MAVKFLMLLWQRQGILARPSSETLVESLYKNTFQANIICNEAVGPLVVQVRSIHLV